MDTEDLKSNIKELVSKAEIKTALEVLSDNHELLSDSQKNQLVMLKSNFRRTNNYQIIGTDSIDKLSLEHRKIANSLLIFVDQLELENNKVENFYDGIKPYLIFSLLIGVISAILIFLIQNL